MKVYINILMLEFASRTDTVQYLESLNRFVVTVLCYHITTAWLIGSSGMPGWCLKSYS